jgi:hypothetical protein
MHRVFASSSTPSKGVSKSHVDKSEFTSWWRALAPTRVIGPLGGLVGLEEVVSESHPVSVTRLRIKLILNRLSISHSHLFNVSSTPFVSYYKMLLQPISELIGCNDILYLWDGGGIMYDSIYILLELLLHKDGSQD